VAKLVYIPQARVYVNPDLVSSVYYALGLTTVRMNNGSIYKTNISVTDMVAKLNGEEV